MKKFGKVFGDHHFEKSGTGFMAYGFFRDGVTLPVMFPVGYTPRFSLSFSRQSTEMDCCSSLPVQAFCLRNSLFRSCRNPGSRAGVLPCFY